MTASSPELRRGFGFWTGWFVVIASMIGSGILTNSGPIMKMTQSYPALMVLWGLGGLLALAGALTMGELASGITRVGGDYAYVHEAFGPAWGFLYGWAMVVLGFAAPIAVVAYTTASFLYPSALHFGVDFGLAPATFAPAVATVMIAILTIAHSSGHRNSAWVQGATTVFKIAVLVGFTTWGMRSDLGSWSHWSESAGLLAVRPVSWASGLILVMYAYTGWNGAVYLAAETRDSARLVPRCLAGGAATVLLIYLLVNAFYVYAFPSSEIASMTDDQTARLAEIAVTKLLGEPVGRLFAVMASLEVFSSLSAYILTGPRIVYAMARDGLCPQFAGRLHPRTHCPVVATVAQGATALIFLWSGTFEQILTFTSYGLAFISTLVIAPIFVLRRRTDFRPTFRVPGYPFTPLFFLAVSLALLVGGAVDNPLTALASLASILLGLPLYALWKRFRA